MPVKQACSSCWRFWQTQNVWPSSSEYFLQCYFTFLSFIFYLCKYIHVCLHKHVCTHIYMHIHIYIHIYTCTYIKNIHKIWTYSLRRLELTMSQKAILCNLNLLFLPSFATPFSSLLSCISLVFDPLSSSLYLSLTCLIKHKTEKRIN